MPDETRAGDADAMRRTRDAHPSGPPGAQRGAAAAVRVVVNGETHTLDAGTTLADLLRAHDLDPRLVVVEHNRAILRDRDAFASLVLRDGDALELVHFVGGG